VLNLHISIEQILIDFSLIPNLFVHDGLISYEIMLSFLWSHLVTKAYSSGTSNFEGDLLRHLQLVLCPVPNKLS